MAAAAASPVAAAGALLLLLLPMWMVIANAVDRPTTHKTRRRVWSTRPFRFLQQEDADASDTCELVKRKTLQRLLNGHEDFVQDLFLSTLSQRQRRRLQKDRSSSSNTTTATVLLAHASSNDMSPRKRHELEIQIDKDDNNGRFTLTEVKTRYRILHSEESGDNIMVPSLLGSHSKDASPLWGTAISGKITKRDNGKRVRYQALLVGGINVTSGMFFYVDKRSSTKNMKRDKRRGIGQDEDEDDGKGRHVTCFGDRVLKDPCRDNVVERYRIAETVLKEPFQDELRAMDAQVAQLDATRFQNLYQAAADCYARQGEKWNPREVMECVNGAKRRLYETHLTDYGILRFHILAQTAKRNLQVRELKLARNQELRSCCEPPNDKNNNSNNNNNDSGQTRNLETSWNEHPLAPRSMTWWPMTNVRAPKIHGDAVRSVPQGSPFPHPWLRQRQRRRLQDSGKDETCQFKTRIDPTELDDLADFSQDLYRSLTSSQVATPPPEDAFVTKGYNAADTQAQTVKLQKTAIRLELRAVQTATIDLTNLAETSEEVPRAVSRFVRNAEFEATVVEGKQTTEDGTEIEFVGILFRRNDKKKQLLWPVDRGRLDAAATSTTTRRGRGRQLLLPLKEEAMWHRDLQTVDTETGTVVCTSSQTRNDACVADAQQTFQEGQAMVQQEQQEALRLLQQQGLDLRVVLLDRHRLAGAECATVVEEGGEGWDLTLMAKCLLEDKVRDIAEAVLTDNLALDNGRTNARLQAAQAIATLRLARDNALEACCEENASNPAPTDSDTTASPNATPPPTTRSSSSPAPASSLADLPTTVPLAENQTAALATETPTSTPTRAPMAVTVSASPTDAPAFNSSVLQQTTASPASLAPSSKPSPIFGNPTRDPVSSLPTQRPTDSPTSAPTEPPSTVMPSEKPTVMPSKTPIGMQSEKPTVLPSKTPIGMQLEKPTVMPSETPTVMPSKTPTVMPSKRPTAAPLDRATRSPTSDPTRFPTLGPSRSPTSAPSDKPTRSPTAPTQGPTNKPSNGPTLQPTASPSQLPTVSPSSSPTVFPSSSPTASPSTVAPSRSPTGSPSTSPTVSPSTSPTVSPSTSPTASPSSVAPSRSPTISPSTSPTLLPTRTPTTRPTVTPTAAPTQNPSFFPTLSPFMPPISCSTSHTVPSLGTTPSSEFTLAGCPTTCSSGVCPIEMVVNFENAVTMTEVSGATKLTALDACGNTVESATVGTGLVLYEHAINEDNMKTLKIEVPADADPPTLEFRSSCTTATTDTCTIHFDQEISDEVTFAAGDNAVVKFFPIDDVEDVVMFVPEVDASGNVKNEANPDGGTISVAFGTSKSVCSVSFRYDGTPTQGTATIQNGSRDITTSFVSSTDNVVSLTVASPGACVSGVVLHLEFSEELYFYDLEYTVEPQTMTATC